MVLYKSKDPNWQINVKQIFEKIFAWLLVEISKTCDDWLDKAPVCYTRS